MAQGDWIHLNRSRPCPVCAGISRCSMHRDGTRGFCRTPEANEGKEPFLDSTGNASWRFDLGSLAGRQHTPLIESRACLEPEWLDYSYQIFLRAGCSETHLRELCRRYGVAWEQRFSLPLRDYCSIDRLDVLKILRELSG